MTERPIFSGPVLAVLVAGATAVFALSILLMLAGPSEQRSSGSDTRSISAIGYAGLYELLKRSDVPLARSQLSGIVDPGDGGLLVMAEPPVDGMSNDDIVRLGHAANVLLVLPKRKGMADPDKPGWISSTAPIDVAAIADIAGLVEPGVDIVRGDSPKAWAHNGIGVDPSFDDGIQLLKSDRLTPIVGDASGMLVAQKLDGPRRIWILTDPDVIENHGLAKGQNAAFAIALLDAMRKDGGKIVFDETIHGMVNVVENPLKKLLQFPYVIVVLLGLAAAALMVWATLSRFGKPRVAPPSFDLGKRRLIATTSSLLDRAGHHAFVLHRYIEITLGDVGRLFRAPRELEDKELANWLDVIAEARGIEARSAAILQSSVDRGKSSGRSLDGLFEDARNIRKWKEQIAHGTPAYRDDRRRYPPRSR